MERNVGGADRAVRIILGIAILGAGAYYRNWWGLIGLAPLVTGLIGKCGLYRILGINTCKIKK